MNDAGENNLMKKALNLLIIITLVLLIGSVAPSFAPALQVDAYTGMTRDQAIEWVQSQLGVGIDYDGVYGPQCVDLIKAYYAALGVSPVKGNGCDYATNALPEGWTRVQGGTPEKGDILVYVGSDSNPYGHVAIYEADYITYHQNFNSHSYVEKVTAYSYRGLSNQYWGYIRPDWMASSASYANLGESFNAVIYHEGLTDGDERRALINEKGDVQLGEEKMTAAEHWIFTRQSDDSYVIESAYDHAVLTLSNSQDENGTSVTVDELTDSDSQKWYLYSLEQQGSEVYKIIPACDPDKCLCAASDGASGELSTLALTETAESACVFDVCIFTDAIPNGISLSPDSAEIEINETLNLQAQIIPESTEANKSGIVWKSSDESVATVTETGCVMGIGKGAARITAYSKYNDNLWADCHVTVICRHLTTEIRNKRAATATKQGYSGDTYCRICGELLNYGNMLPVAREEHQVVPGVPASITLSAGYSAVAGGDTYTVLSPSSRTVAFTQANNSYSVIVPDTVNIAGTIYMVTQIDPGAFKNPAIKTVTIGKNVTSIKEKAFAGSKVSKVILKTKLLKKADVKGSLAGSRVKAIKVKLGSKKANKKYKSRYKKIFKKANSGKKIKVS